jgi:hypothetical protein
MGQWPVSIRGRAERVEVRRAMNDARLCDPWLR